MPQNPQEACLTALVTTLYCSDLWVRVCRAVLLGLRATTGGIGQSICLICVIESGACHTLSYTRRFHSVRIGCLRLGTKSPRLRIQNKHGMGAPIASSLQSGKYCQSLKASEEDWKSYILRKPLFCLAFLSWCSCCTMASPLPRILSTFFHCQDTDHTL